MYEQLKALCIYIYIIYIYTDSERSEECSNIVITEFIILVMYLCLYILGKFILDKNLINAVNT